MSLPELNLDDRKFQEIVDEMKRKIALRCPEWTEHNVSDPGVTLIELFAQVTEMMLFRLNQVPEKNYRKFLEMIGIQLETQQAAQADLRFNLTKALHPTENEVEDRLLTKWNTVVGTLRRETEESIEFELMEDILMVRPGLMKVAAVDHQQDIANEPKIRDLAFDKPRKEDDGFQAYSLPPEVGDAIYFGFDGEIRGNVVQIRLQCLEAAATGLKRSQPLQVWECWNSGRNDWEMLIPTLDSTFGFDQNGAVELEIPRTIARRMLFGERLYYVRCRYSLDAEELGYQLNPGQSLRRYEKSPEIIGVDACTVGGIARASNCTTIQMEILGTSDGLPGQAFRVQRAPTLALLPEDHILVGPVDAEPADCEVYELVPDFSRSTEFDRHFTFDPLLGEILFGPVIDQPDGSTLQYGAIPPKGMTITLSSYRVGGGVAGNLRSNQIRMPRQSYAFIDTVTNSHPATGGRDLETLERAKMRALHVLKVRDRAVTAEDYEELAMKGPAPVGRACCIQAISSTGEHALMTPPGTVKVLLIPQVSKDIQAPTPTDLRVSDRSIIDVRKYLDERRLLTTVLDVGEPDYIYASIDVTLVMNPRFDQETVTKNVLDRLYAYIHPVYGGPAGMGWPFGKALTLADVYAQIAAIQGVAFLLEAKILVSRVENRETGRLGQESVASNEEGIRLSRNEVMCSRQHRVRVVPISAVGSSVELEG